jgi:hypothetical protein
MYILIIVNVSWLGLIKAGYNPVLPTHHFCNSFILKLKTPRFFETVVVVISPHRRVDS